VETEPQNSGGKQGKRGKGRKGRLGDDDDFFPAEEEPRAEDAKDEQMAQVGEGEGLSGGSSHKGRKDKKKNKGAKRDQSDDQDSGPSRLTGRDLEDGEEQAEEGEEGKDEDDEDEEEGALGPSRGQGERTAEERAEQGGACLRLLRASPSWRKKGRKRKTQVRARRARTLRAAARSRRAGGEPRTRTRRRRWCGPRKGRRRRAKARRGDAGATMRSSGGSLGTSPRGSQAPPLLRALPQSRVVMTGKGLAGRGRREEGAGCRVRGRVWRGGPSRCQPGSCGSGGGRGPVGAARAQVGQAQAMPRGLWGREAVCRSCAGGATSGRGSRSSWHPWARPSRVMAGCSRRQW